MNGGRELARACAQACFTLGSDRQWDLNSGNALLYACVHVSMYVMWAEQFARPLVVPFAFEMFCLSADRRATNSLSLKRTMARQPGHSIVTSIGFDQQKKLWRLLVTRASSR